MFLASVCNSLTEPRLFPSGVVKCVFVGEVGILSDRIPLFSAKLMIACLESEMISESFESDL